MKYKPLNIISYKWLDIVGKLVFDTRQYKDEEIEIYRNLHCSMLLVLKYMWYVELKEGYFSEEKKKCEQLLNQYKEIII